jgi:hypothetical protein
MKTMLYIMDDNLNLRYKYDKSKNSTPISLSVDKNNGNHYIVYKLGIGEYYFNNSKEILLVKTTEEILYVIFFFFKKFFI